MINLLYTVLCITCLCMGFFCGYKLGKGENKQVILPNPVKTVKQKIEKHKEEEKIREQLEEINTIYENLENYDGTGNNQKELRNIEIGVL